MVKFQKVNFQERAKNRHKVQNSCCGGNYGGYQTQNAVAMMAGMALAQIFSNISFNKTSAYTQVTTGADNKIKTKDIDVVGTGDTPVKKEKTVNEIKELIANKYNNIIPAITTNWDEITKKYNAHYMTSETWTNKDEAEVIKRLVNYDKALRSNRIQTTWDIRYQETFNTILEEKNITEDDFYTLSSEEQQAILDECTARCEENAVVDLDKGIQEFNKPNPNNDDIAKYLVNIADRGAGYVEMYDKDEVGSEGHGTISLEEFQAFIAKNNEALFNYIDADRNQVIDEKEMPALYGVSNVEMYDKDEVGSEGHGTISLDEFQAFKAKNNEALFNYIDADGNQVIDEKEMAAYLYGVSRINETEDGDTNTSHDITFTEWQNSQNWLSDIENKDSDTFYVNMTKWRDKLMNNQFWKSL